MSLRCACSKGTAKLDFIHLERAVNVERQVCKLLLTLEPKEGRNAVSACHSDAADCTICALSVQARVGTRPGFARGGAAGPWQAHGDGRVTSDGLKPGGAVSEISSGAESGAVVERSGGPRVIQPRGRHLCACWASDHWDRRYVGAAAGREEQSQRDLSRPGAFLALPYGESQWVALALCDGLGRDSVGGTGLGLTVSNRLVSL